MGLDALCRCLLFSRQAEDLLQQHSSSRVDEATSYADVKPCNSYLRRLIYQVLEHRYVTCAGSSTKCWNTGMLPAHCAGSSNKYWNTGMLPAQAHLASVCVSAWRFGGCE